MAKNIQAIVAAGFLTVTVAALSFGGTFAYLTNTENRLNSIFVGENKITVDEDVGNLVAKPGAVVDKKPFVENTGNLDCFVRMRVDFSTSVAGLPNNEGGYCTLDYNTTDWEYNADDGYWYYKHILPVGGSTEDNALFTTATISNDVAEDDMEEFDIYIYAESHQVGDFEESDYMSDVVWGG